MANCANDKMAFFQIYSVLRDLEQSKKPGYLKQTTRVAPYWGQSRWIGSFTRTNRYLQVADTRYCLENCTFSPALEPDWMGREIVRLPIPVMLILAPYVQITPAQGRSITI